MSEPTPDPTQTTPPAPPPPADPPVEAPKSGRRRAAEDQADDQADDRPKRGDLVGYRHPDPITGATLTGVGVVLWAPDGEGALTVAPLSQEFLEVEPSNLVLASLEDDVDDDTAGV